MQESKSFPKIQVVKYSYNPDIIPAVYHLIINEEYSGCFANKADLLKRLNMVMAGEVFKI
jgi:hypothetical protein